MSLLSAAKQAAPKTFTTARGATGKAHRVMVYGPGGIGKTTLARLIESVGRRVVFGDVESGSRFIDAERFEGIETFGDVLALCHEPILAPGDALVLDTVTKLEEMAGRYVCDTIQTQAGKKATCLEDYGYGKGYAHLYDAMNRLLFELDRQHQRGINVVLLAHDNIVSFSNPSGEDYIRYEPRLYQGRNVSVRHRFREWVDHLFFYGYRTFVKDGKASSTAERVIYVQETPAFWAKSRTLSKEVIVRDATDATLWNQLFGGNT